MFIPMGWRLARTRSRNGTTGHHGDWDRLGLIRTTNKGEAAAGHGTVRCKACEQYFHGLALARAHECEREDAYRTFVALPSQEAPAVAATEVEAPTQEAEAQPQPGFNHELFIQWINDLVVDRNRLRGEIEVARLAISDAEQQAMRLKAEVSHQQTVAERFRSVVLARESANDFGDWHTRKSAIK